MIDKILYLLTKKKDIEKIDIEISNDTNVIQKEKKNIVGKFNIYLQKYYFQHGTIF